MVPMRYPTVRLGLSSRLGQISDQDVFRLKGTLASIENLYGSLPQAVQDRFGSDLQVCRDAVSWASSTRDWTDYMDAGTCLTLLESDLERAGQITFEDPQVPAGVQLVPTESGPSGEGIKRLTPWAVAGVVAGVVIMGLAVWSAAQ